LLTPSYSLLFLINIYIDRERGRERERERERLAGKHCVVFGKHIVVFGKHIVVFGKHLVWLVCDRPRTVTVEQGPKREKWWDGCGALVSLDSKLRKN
jgi:hypothetical protein